MNNKPGMNDIIVDTVPHTFGGIPGGGASFGGAPRADRDYEQQFYDGRESFRAASSGGPRYTGRPGTASQDYYGPGSYGSNQTYWDNYTSQFDTYGYEPPSSTYPREQNVAPFLETFIGFHHSRRGVRLIVQGSTKVFLIILAVVFMLLSRPGVLDVVGTLLRGLDSR